MGREKIRIKAWPFKKGEKAKLVWIGEPFKQNNKWMINAYFKGDKRTIKVLMDWASGHFLVTEKYYTNGVLNKAEAADNSEVVDIDLKSAKVNYGERPWEVWGSGFKDKTKSKTFSFVVKGELYTIPLIEIIRAILAPSKFMLNRILELDSFENYFTYNIEGRILEIHFTSEYERKLLKEDKINHLAWLITNPQVLRMFNKVGQNIWQYGELKFDFLMDNFNIRARVEKKAKYTKILEILALRKKKINVEEINIYHPSLEESQNSNQAKLRKYVNKGKDSDKELTTEGDGSTKVSEEIEAPIFTHEYVRLPQIHRRKRGARTIRKREDENTEKYVLEDDGLRTTADVGGEKLIRGMEFTSVDKVEEKGELEEFIEILKLLEKRPNIKVVEVITGELPEGKKGKRFARLSDGVTRRRYAIGKIIMMNGRECSLIDVEREGRALSMLILKGDKLTRWKEIYNLMLLSLVNESGNWSSQVVNRFKIAEIEVLRVKHIKKNKYEKVNRMYEKINY